MKRFMVCMVVLLLARLDVAAGTIFQEDFSECQAGWHWVPDNTTANARLIDYFQGIGAPVWDPNHCTLVSDAGGVCYRIGEAHGGYSGHYMVAGAYGAPAYLTRTGCRITVRFVPLSSSTITELTFRFQNNTNK